MQLSVVYILCGSVLEGVVVWPCAAQWRGCGVQLSGVYCVELQWRGLYCCDVQLSELQWRNIRTLRMN